MPAIAKLDVGQIAYDTLVDYVNWMRGQKNVLAQVVVVVVAVWQCVTRIDSSEKFCATCSESLYCNGPPHDITL